VVKIHIEFVGFPTIYDLFTAGFHPYAFQGSSLFELVEDLIAHYGDVMRESLLDQRAKTLDQTIQVRLNQNYLSREEVDKQELEEGDDITFLKLLAGG
jgi:sulfur carrier protein ThiS